MSDNRDNGLHLLGLAMKGKLIAVGRSAVEKNFRRGKLLILAKDLSKKSKEKFMRDARFYRIEFIEKWTMAEIGEAIGRKPVGVVLVLDKGMAQKLKETAT